MVLTTGKWKEPLQFKYIRKVEAPFHTTSKLGTLSSAVANGGESILSLLNKT